MAVAQAAASGLTPLTEAQLDQVTGGGSRNTGGLDPTSLSEIDTYSGLTYVEIQPGIPFRRMGGSVSEDAMSWSWGVTQQGTKAGAGAEI